MLVTSNVSSCAIMKALLANELPDLGNPSITTCLSGVTARVRSLRVRNKRYKAKKTVGLPPAWIWSHFSSHKEATFSSRCGLNRSSIALIALPLPSCRLQFYTLCRRLPFQLRRFDWKTGDYVSH